MAEISQQASQRCIRATLLYDNLSCPHAVEHRSAEDIEARVRAYVRGLAPKVRGVGVGERLSIIFPGAQSSPGYGYISEHTCDPLALLASLFPDRMLSLVMAEVERMANDPLPVAQRAPRIAVAPDPAQPC